MENKTLAIETILDIIEPFYNDVMVYDDKYIVGGQIFDELCQDEDDDCFAFKKTIKQLQKFKSELLLKEFMNKVTYGK